MKVGYGSLKRIIIAIVAVLSTFIATTLAVSAIILNGDGILTSFSIISVDNVSTNFVVRHQRVRAAVHYDIIVYDENGVQVFATTVYNTTSSISLPMLQYGVEYTIMIYAFDRVGDRVVVNNPFRFRYTEPTFSSENGLVLRDNEDYILLIDGNLDRRDYRIRIVSNGIEILEERLRDNEFIIDSAIFSGREAVFEIEIIDGLIPIHQISLYSNLSPISDITITSPEADAVLHFNDVTFTFEGGQKATEYLLQIYHGRNLIKETNIRRNRVVISHEIFERAQNYRFVLIASYQDYEEFTKTAEVSFAMNDRFTLMPAYINVNHRFVRSGTEITLNHPNASGNIFFTLDGSDPSTNGVRYTEPIIVTESVMLRTVVMEPLFNNSVIGEFPINIGTKRSFSVYLSPSNQRHNLGVESAGFTNEMREMNYIADHIGTRLSEHGVRVYRNNPAGNISLWTAESRFRGVDLHLALHSNASPQSNAFGIETWINEQTSGTFSMASAIQNALMEIYWSDEPRANRGVRFANGALGEVNEQMVPFGILVEIAFHDYEQDAAWMVQNREQIANSIADAVLRYFQVI